jgi:3-hydroxyisobutyrate dehydrogenase-like beta-hydroxyacid dehydrogenase
VVIGDFGRMENQNQMKQANKNESLLQDKVPVSMIGLGSMGTALARALLREGHHVTVWNRTGAKAELLVRDGAIFAPSAAVAIGASPVVLICVADYKASRGIFETEEVASRLAGQVLIQLTSGTPQEARVSEAWAWERNVEYLDGKILAWPRHIGTPDATIVVSGAESAFERGEPVLKSLAGNVTYLGEQIGSASALHLAGTSYLVGNWLGFVHGACIYESEGLRVDSFGSMLAGLAPILAAEAKHLGEVVQAGAYENPGSSIATDTVAIERIIQQARESQINSKFPTFALGLFQQAIAAGYGEEEVAALIKVLRTEPKEDSP